MISIVKLAEKRKWQLNVMIHFGIPSFLQLYFLPGK